jgi:mRNA interferase YafQ
LNIQYTSQFKKDYKKVQKQNKDSEKLKLVIEKLLSETTLEDQYKDHNLTGKWKNYRECHISPDWLLIYKKTADSLILVRTGSHSELFIK